MVDLVPLYSTTFYEESDIPGFSLTAHTRPRLPAYVAESLPPATPSPASPRRDSLSPISSPLTPSSPKSISTPTLPDTPPHSGKADSLLDTMMMVADPPTFLAPGLEPDLENYDSGHASPVRKIHDSTLSGSSNSSTTIYIRYVAKDLWKQFSFPMGLTVTQARDICMLRCNIWSPFATATDGTPVETSGTGNGRSKRDLFGTGGAHRRTSEYGISSLSSAGDGPQTGQPVGFDTDSNHSTQPAAGQSLESFRQQYGLYWVAAGHWLDPNRRLSSYPLTAFDVVELQHVNDFVYISPLEYHHHYAEGYLFKLYMNGLSPAWKLRWFVVRGLKLLCYKKKTDATPLGCMDFQQPVQVCEPSSTGLWDEPASPPPNSTAATRNPHFQHLIDNGRPPSMPVGPVGALSGTPSAHPLGGPSGGGGGPSGSGMLTVQVGDQHITVKTQNIMEHEHWRRILTGLQRESDTLRAAKAQQDALRRAASVSRRSSIASVATNGTGSGRHTQPQPRTFPSMFRSKSKTLQQLNIHAAGSQPDQRPSEISPHLEASMDQADLTHKTGWVSKRSSIGYGVRRRYAILCRGQFWLFKDDVTALASPVYQQLRSRGTLTAASHFGPASSASSLRSLSPNLSALSIGNGGSGGSGFGSGLMNAGNLTNLGQVCVELTHEGNRYHFRITLVGESLTQLRKNYSLPSHRRGGTQFMMTSSSSGVGLNRSAASAENVYGNRARSRDTLFGDGHGSSASGFPLPPGSIGSGSTTPTSAYYPTSPVGLVALSTVATGGFLKNIPDKRVLNKVFVESWEECQAWKEAFLHVGGVPVDDLIQGKLWIPRLDLPRSTLVTPATTSSHNPLPTPPVSAFEVGPDSTSRDHPPTNANDAVPPSTLHPLPTGPRSTSSNPTLNETAAMYGSSVPHASSMMYPPPPSSLHSGSPRGFHGNDHSASPMSSVQTFSTLSSGGIGIPQGNGGGGHYHRYHRQLPNQRSSDVLIGAKGGSGSMFSQSVIPSNPTMPPPRLRPSYSGNGKVGSNGSDTYPAVAKKQSRGLLQHFMRDHKV
ncbi:hypothetical protein IWQ60_009717 [Tieghemiomyces parasiticus]|uniref:PH domain-containing protein n=1 Tax=Tieghemiomyces parasiticus TaxID=78921 RepID=A0A9W7ZV95_9FUNG|nr:hypothetical protein IWQ60_009717 [Tieghemiomyces parasiticus]